MNRAAMTASLLAIASSAGRAILETTRNGIDVDIKPDASPVTVADHASESVIIGALRKKWPEYMIVAEEATAAGEVPAHLGHAFFLVDPLDGTKEFINGRSEYTVNIALVVERIPVVGVVLAPDLGQAWTGWHDGDAAEALNHQLDAALEPLTSVPISTGCMSYPPSIIASRSHMTRETETFLERFDGCRVVNIGSSIKFCHIADGTCDLYPRFAPTMQWDTAAGDAVLRAAGGMTWQADGKPLAYGDTGQATRFLNPDFVAACAHVEPATLGLGDAS